MKVINMAQVLKFLLLSVLILACVATAEDAERNISSLLNIHGDCYYDGIKIKNGNVKKPKEFCEKWTCKNGKLKIDGCSLPERYGSCTYWNSGRLVFPQCCNYQRVC
uniref:Single domain-containing protein n=1 Tax=Amblyomma parvum TaxID=251391 RepID=A0A023G0I9_AMBPA